LFKRFTLASQQFNCSFLASAEINSLAFYQLAFKRMEQYQSENISADSLFDGELICLQHVNGYRFSVDAVLLAHFVRVKKQQKILDLGTGSGVVMLILLYRWYEMIAEIVGLEMQHNLLALAQKNLEKNKFSHIGKAVVGDVKNLALSIDPESFDSVVCNPPFYAQGSGRHNPCLETDLARHQVAGSLSNFLQSASYAVKNKGLVFFIYPAIEITTFISCCSKYRLTPKRLQFVYSYPQAKQDARLVLIECCKNGAQGVRVLKPLFIYKQKDGTYSDEVQSWYLPNRALATNQAQSTLKDA
jgi:tRNA1Val (adenine37-N6)-methyltransferase